MCTRPASSDSARQFESRWQLVLLAGADRLERAPELQGFSPIPARARPSARGLPASEPLGGGDQGSKRGRVIRAKEELLLSPMWTNGAFHEALSNAALQMQRQMSRVY